MLQTGLDFQQSDLTQSPGDLIQNAMPSYIFHFHFQQSDLTQSPGADNDVMFFVDSISYFQQSDLTQSPGELLLKPASTIASKTHLRSSAIL